MNQAVELTTLEMNANGARITQMLVEKALELAGNLRNWDNLEVLVAPDIWSDLCALYGGTSYSDRIRRSDGMHAGEIFIMERKAEPEHCHAHIFNLGSSPAAGKPTPKRQYRTTSSSAETLEIRYLAAERKMTKAAVKLAAQSKVIATGTLNNPSYLREWRHGIEEAQSALDSYETVGKLLEAAKSNVP